MSLDAASLEKLIGVESDLAEIVVDAAEIIPLKVIEGHRGEEAQERAFTEGKTKLHWPHGKHNSLPSKAVDLAPLNFDMGKKDIDWGDIGAFGRVMGVIEACAFRRGKKLRFGLDWDGDYRSVGRDPNESFLDAPHVEVL